ncbi:SHOCT domain-containing protein [Parafrigoribacterium soli]|uniref:SHOCT domain-containing protein n=1 Tax=Parafrigoribacterium soli TaxID=3144663 RepID=UPI0032EC474D
MLSTLALPAIAAAHWGGPWAGGFGFLWLLVPLFWLTVLFLIFGVFGRRWRRAHWQAGYGFGHGPWGAPSRAAETTLAERFAQGDIDEKEYRARLEVLRANNPQPPHAN